MAGLGAGGMVHGAKVVEPAHPSARQPPLDMCVGRQGGLHHIGREESGDDGDCHDNGVEKVGDNAQGEAERGYDEGELANLRHGEAALHGGLQRLAAKHEPHGAEECLPEDDGHDEHHDGECVGDKDMRVDEHAHGDEEDGAEEVLDRVYDTRYLVGLDSLGEDATHDEGTEGGAEANGGGDNGHGAAQPKRHHYHRLAVHQTAGTAQEWWYEEYAHDKP